MSDVAEDLALHGPEDGFILISAGIMIIRDREEQVADESIDQEPQSDLSEEGFPEAAHSTVGDDGDQDEDCRHQQGCGVEDIVEFPFCLRLTGIEIVADDVFGFQSPITGVQVSVVAAEIGIGVGVFCSIEVSDLQPSSGGVDLGQCISIYQIFADTTEALLTVEPVFLPRKEVHLPVFTFSPLRNKWWYFSIVKFAAFLRAYLSNGTAGLYLDAPHPVQGQEEAQQGNN